MVDIGLRPETTKHSCRRFSSCLSHFVHSTNKMNLDRARWTDDWPRVCQNGSTSMLFNPQLMSKHVGPPCICCLHITMFDRVHRRHNTRYLTRTCGKPPSMQLGVAVSTESADPSVRLDVHVNTETLPTYVGHNVLAILDPRKCQKTIPLRL